MNFNGTKKDNLLTWLDVDRMLKQKTALWSNLPANVSAVDCFSDGMDVRYSADIDGVHSWIADVFGAAYDRENASINLRIDKSTYAVNLILDGSIIEGNGHQAYPLWRDVTYLPTSEQGNISNNSSESLPSAWPDGPEMVSFHSFKGGVGRTTALMTYVAACMDDRGVDAKKILVIDADLEAPGVSFWLDDMNYPSVSFVQFMEAIHYPPVSVEHTVEYFASELRKTSLNVGGVQRELFILPAALALTEIEDMPVTPEHLARDPENPWRLSDNLHALGKKLGVDAVFIDLRAGLSELASPILFDPRVDHFFVTTVAPQSVLGMSEVLRRLHAFNRRLPTDRQLDARPTVVLSLLTKELRESSDYQKALQALGEAYPIADDLVSGIQWLEAEFLSTLMSIGTVRDGLRELRNSNLLFASASEWAEMLYEKPAILPPATAPAKNELAAKLKRICETAQFAEGNNSPQILATEPLRNLGKHFSKEIPNLLMIGAKGAGKTFTYMQLLRSKNWSDFLEKLGFDKNEIVDAAIFPALWSGNIVDKPDGDVKSAQENVISLIGGDVSQLYRASELAEEIKSALNTPPISWLSFWDRLITRQFGIVHGGLEALNEKLAASSKRVIIVFDGLEDSFKDVSQTVMADAVEALLKLPDRLSELRNRHIGAVVFVRVDYVQASVRQNFGQLLQRYQPFRLQWDAESFLRLVH
ncbi:KGGVGR-motif variant AAA ATPase [Rhizobium sp.]|jgi:cellulose biosynthesis protein BcsQ|uniref:ParA family protein n=1 Tax=Rhizobium sp. TaxID=391 RepID=UPI000E8C4519|nr:ParA family protein [Rhizobium sp.]